MQLAVHFMYIATSVYSCINYALRNTWLKGKMDMICLKHKKDWYVRMYVHA